MEREIVCIKCPIGCRMKAEKKADGTIKVTGNLCPVGEKYAIEELTEPKRLVTSLIKGEDKVYPCKTSIEIPKDKIFAVLDEIAKVKLSSAKIGEVVIRNVLNTGADVVITGN